MEKRIINSKSLISFLGVILAVCITTIGYSAFNSNLNISGEAIIKVDNNISIVDLNVSNVEGDAYELYNSNHSNKTIDYHIILPDASSSITYKIDIKNKTDRNYGIASITGLPSNLTYELINYNLGDKLCTNSVCNNGSVDEIYFKIKYQSNEYDSTNINFSSRIKLQFEYFYNVVYRNVSGSTSLKQSVLKGTNYEERISIPDNHKLIVRMNGILLVKDNGYFYDTSTNMLTIPSVTSNIVISIAELGFEFDLTNTGQERPFGYYNTEYNISTQTFYLEADLSNVDLTDEFENIISIGNDIDYWSVGKSYTKGTNLHIYYPATANTKSIQADLTYLAENNVGLSAKFQKNLNALKSNLIRLAFNKNGLYINGEKIFDKTGKGNNVSSQSNNDILTFLETFFDYFETNSLSVGIGSTEGSNRSNAIYNQIEIYNNLLTVTEMVEKTKIIVEETPSSEEVTYEQVSAVRINNSTQSVLINYPFQPDNNKFIFTLPQFIDLNSNSLYLKIDVSNLKEEALLENLISVGNNFSHWTGSNVYDFHVYYPYTVDSNEISIALLNGTSYIGQFRNNVSLIDNKFIKMVLCNFGLYINGEKWLDSTGFIKDDTTVFGNSTTPSLVVSKFFEKFTYPNDNTINFIYGSEQGSNRSSATYNDMRIYDKGLTEDQIIRLTS